MYPEFFHIGPLAIRAFGVMLSLSFLIGLWLLEREARVLKIDPVRAFNFGFILIVCGLLGGRLAFALYHLNEFAGRPWDIINPFQTPGHFGIAGLNLQGGLIGGLIAGLVYARARRLPLLLYCDAAAPPVAFGMALSRIGCFLNGCCFGTPTTGICGMHFPPGSPAYAVFGSEAIHPTQLYSSAYALVLFLALLWVNRHRSRAGVTAALFLMIEAIFRLLIEPLRYYEAEMWTAPAGFPLNYNQLVAVALFALGLVFLALSRRRGGKTA